MKDLTNRRISTNLLIYRKFNLHRSDYIYNSLGYGSKKKRVEVNSIYSCPKLAGWSIVNMEMSQLHNPILLMVIFLHNYRKRGRIAEMYNLKNNYLSKVDIVDEEDDMQCYDMKNLAPLLIN